MNLLRPRCEPPRSISATWVPHTHVNNAGSSKHRNTARCRASASRNLELDNRHWRRENLLWSRTFRFSNIGGQAATATTFVLLFLHLRGSPTALKIRHSTRGWPTSGGSGLFQTFKACWSIYPRHAASTGNQNDKEQQELQGRENQSVSVTTW